MERSTNSIIIPNQERDPDERGSILSIVDACVMNVSIISQSRFYTVKPLSPRRLSLYAVVRKNRLFL